MSFLEEYGADLLVLLIIAGMVALAVRTLTGRWRQGKSCGCGCSGCPKPSRRGGSKKTGEQCAECGHRE